MSVNIVVGWRSALPGSDSEPGPCHHLPVDYDRDTPITNGAWSEFTSEYEKAAFQESMGHLVGGMWMWQTTADPPDPAGTSNPGIPRDGGYLSLESATQRPAAGTVCSTTVTPFPGSPPITVAVGHRRMMCITRALWDIVDNSPSDGDAIQNRDLGDIVDVFRSYNRGCIPFFDNGCVNEVGRDDGMNWSDFRRNYESVFPESLNGIEGNNDLENSDDT